MPRPDDDSVDMTLYAGAPWQAMDEIRARLRAEMDELKRLLGTTKEHDGEANEKR